MINIPENTLDTKASDIEYINSELVKRLNSSPTKTYTAFSHALKYGRETLYAVMDEWKKKGWYTYYQRRFDGAILDLQFYTTEQHFSRNTLNYMVRY